MKLPRRILMFDVFVAGKPIPQGSMSTMHRGGRCIMYHTNKKLKPWRNRMTWAFVRFVQDHKMSKGAYSVDMIFNFKRPKSKKINALHTVPPDADKLERAVYDALKQSGIVADDAQICGGWKWKSYAQDGEPEGVRIKLFKLAGVLNERKAKTHQKRRDNAGIQTSIRETDSPLGGD